MANEGSFSAAVNNTNPGAAKEEADDEKTEVVDDVEEPSKPKSKSSSSSSDSDKGDDE